MSAPADTGPADGAPVPLPEITDEQMQAGLATTRPYTAVLLRATAAAGEPGAGTIVWEHGRRNFALQEAGLLPVVCPAPGEGEFAGVCLFAAPPEEVDRLMADDPGVRAGLFTFEVHPVIGFPGAALP